MDSLFLFCWLLLWSFSSIYSICSESLGASLNDGRRYGFCICLEMQYLLYASALCPVCFTFDGFLQVFQSQMPSSSKYIFLTCYMLYISNVCLWLGLRGENLQDILQVVRLSSAHNFRTWAKHALNKNYFVLANAITFSAAVMALKFTHPVSLSLWQFATGRLPPLAIQSSLFP